MRIPNEALRQRITIAQPGGSGAYGPVFGASRDVKASIQQITSLTVDWKDEEVVVSTMAIVRPEDGPVPIGSKVTGDGQEFVVVKCFPIPDGFRPSHYELMLRSWGYES